MMKTLIHLLALGILVVVSAPQAAAQPDLVVGGQNASFSYNGSTRRITNLKHFMDNQGDYCHDDFTTAIHFVDVSSGQAYKIAEHRRTGLANHDVIASNNPSLMWSFAHTGTIDLNNAPEPPPSGTYKLRITIDSDEEVDETDESNNVAFLTEDGFEIPYTAPGSTSVVPDVLSGVSFGPNPVADGQFRLSGLTQPADIQVVALDGREVLRLQGIQHDQAVVLPTGLPAGLYLLSIQVETHQTVRKLVVN